MIALPIAVAVTGHTATDIAVVSALSLLVLTRHWSNLRRLVRGEELGLDPTQDADGEVEGDDEVAG
jgi:glycerol-3-phosphate acyltransferase PlsY